MLLRKIDTLNVLFELKKRTNENLESENVIALKRLAL